MLSLLPLIAAMSVSAPNASETLTLGGGCFWCLEAVYADVRGVSKVTSGYAGGTDPKPDYEKVSSGRTGHAEVVQIDFDPGIVTRDTLLAIYFTIHDPTTLNQQGADRGTQYRSVAFYRDDAQKAAIEKAIAAARADHPNPIVTQVVPFEVFYPAENYHQQYFKLHGHEPYCNLVIAPKVAKFRKKFHDYLK